MSKVPLTSICDFQGGSQPPKSEWINNPKHGYVRMLQIRDFTTPNEKYIQYIKDVRKVKRCTSNDILIARYGASIGKIVTGLSGAYNVALMKITPNQNLSNKYLLHFLKSNLFQNYIKNVGSRAAQAGFNKNDLKDLQISLPSLPKQKQIADTLDKANELINLRKESIKKLDELSKSVFMDMFGDPIENPKGWNILKLEKLGDWKGGGTPSRSKPEYFKGSIPWITTVSLGDLYIDDSFAVEYITEEAIIKSATKLIPKNSIIIGTRVGVGKVSINLDEICTNQDIISLTNIENSFNIIFIVFFINHYNSILENMKRGATIQGITSKNLKNIDSIKPSIELQNQFAKKIEKIEQQKALYEKQLEKLQYNFEALLAKSFEE